MNLPLTPQSFEASGIPHHMRESLLGYVNHGHPPGDFLHAILMNDFVRAAGRADEDNKRALFAYAAFLYLQIPMGAWGSPSAVTRWITLGGYLGRATLHQESEA